MEPEKYGDKYQEHFLEQYKLYVQMADNISARRSQTNQFYVSLLSALLGIITLGSTILGDKAGVPDALQKWAYLAISILGILLCIIWYINIQSYRQLNSGKFQVVHKMESTLPFAPYDEEWEILGRGENTSKYRPLTHIERYIPMLVGVPFAIIVVYLLFFAQ